MSHCWATVTKTAQKNDSKGCKENGCRRNKKEDKSFVRLKRQGNGWGGMMSWRDTSLGQTCGKLRYIDYSSVYGPLPATACLQHRELRWQLYLNMTGNLISQEVWLVWQGIMSGSNGGLKSLLNLVHMWKLKWEKKHISFFYRFMMLE